MILDRLTWVGFMIVALGWALLISAPQLAELLMNLTGHAMNAGYLNTPTIALCTVLAGIWTSYFRSFADRIWCIE